ncbi:MAG: hypothetical protein ABJC09_03355 [Terriglobia bacterium]
MIGFIPNRWPSSATCAASLRDTFCCFESGSIRQIVYQMGQRILEEIPSIVEVNLEADNRTWDTISEQGSFEQGSAAGVFTEARPPYGCPGLSLRR